MKISIAMASYNGSNYIKDQLKSFADQTRLPDEVIITDDCSTDETEAIIRDFSKKAPFEIEFHRNEENLGYCGNFNAALMKTTGDIVFLSDQDDVWFPNKIEHMIGLAEQNPQALVLMNDAILTDGELNEVGLTKIGQIRSAGLSQSRFVMGCCCTIRRELLNLCIPIPEGVKGHDNWLVKFAEGLNAKIIDPTALQYYRRHDSNESQFIANSIKKATFLQEYLDALKKYLSNNSALIFREQIKQLDIFLRGIRRAKEADHRNYSDLLLKLEDECLNDIEIYKKRLEAVSNNFFSRFKIVFLMLLRGDYRTANGLRSAIRDILG